MAERPLPCSARGRVGAEHPRAAVRSRPRPPRGTTRSPLRPPPGASMRQRVPGVGARRAGARRRPAASARPCSGSVRSSSAPTRTSVGGATSSRRCDEALGGGDRPALPDVVGGVVLAAAGRGTRRASPGSRSSDAARERRVPDPGARRATARAPRARCARPRRACAGRGSTGRPRCTSARAPARRTAGRARSRRATAPPSECPTSDRSVELERVDDRAEVGGPALQRELPLLELAGARAAAKVDAHELVARCRARRRDGSRGPPAGRARGRGPAAGPRPPPRRGARRRRRQPLLSHRSVWSPLEVDVRPSADVRPRRGWPAPTVRTPPRAEA